MVSPKVYVLNSSPLSLEIIVAVVVLRHDGGDIMMWSCGDGYAADGGSSGGGLVQEWQDDGGRVVWWSGGLVVR